MRLGFGMQRLAENPARRQEIVNDPSLIPAAMEELLRLDPPAPFIPRVTTEEVTLAGHTLPAGSRITSYLAVANRDEQQFPNPYEIDFHRTENRHISFGMGVHRCLGSHLARLENAGALRRVAQAHPRLPHQPGYDTACALAARNGRTGFPALDDRRLGLKVSIDASKCMGHGMCY